METVNLLIQLTIVTVAAVGTWYARRAVVTTGEVHKLVNSRLTRVLEANYALAKRIHALTGSPSDKEVMDSANQSLRDVSK